MYSVPFVNLLEDNLNNATASLPTASNLSTALSIAFFLSISNRFIYFLLLFQSSESQTCQSYQE